MTFLGTYTKGRSDHYYGETGRTPEIPPYNLTAIFTSDVNSAVKNSLKISLTETQIKKLRSKTDLAWCRNDDPVISCIDGCLFDLKNDPCETNNIINRYPKIAEILFKQIDKFYTEMIPQKIPVVDLRANPLNYNGTWCTWLDDELCVKTALE